MAPSFLLKTKIRYMKDNLFIVKEKAELVPLGVISTLDPLTIGVYCKLLVSGSRENSRPRDLGAEWGLSEEKVRKCINTLEDAGYIEKKARFENGKIGGMDTFVLGFSVKGEAESPVPQEQILFVEEKRDRFEEKDEKFREECSRYIGEFPEDMVKKFISYWSEPNKSRTKMRWEMETTWETHRRMCNWANRDNIPINKAKSVDDVINSIYG